MGAAEVVGPYASCNGRTVHSGCVDHRQDPVSLGVRRAWPDLGRNMAGAAEHEIIGSGHDASEGLVGDVGVEVGASAGDAGLATCREDPSEQSVDRVIEVGIGEDELRRFATEFECGRCEVVRSGMSDIAHRDIPTGNAILSIPGSP